MTDLAMGQRVRIIVPSWGAQPAREYIGRIVAIESTGRIHIHTSAGVFDPRYTSITPAPSHRAPGNVNPLEGLPTAPIPVHTHTWIPHPGGLRLCACGQSVRPVGAIS